MPEAPSPETAAPKPPHHETPVGWDEIHIRTKDIATKLAPLGPWRAIVAVARGGLVPATILAYELGIPMIDTICISTHSETGERLALTMRKILAGDGEGCLVVDDLTDTGRTFQTIKTYLPRAHYVSLYTKPDGQKEVNTFSANVGQDVWIRFPWEKYRTP